MENYKPLVSIIMPVYNAGNFLLKSIESVTGQTYGNWELLIFDDASNDGTKEVLKNINHPKIKVWYGDKNIGAFGSKNFLFTKAQGEFITFLDADDYMSSRRIELQLNAMLANSDLGMAGCQVAYVNNDNRVLRTSNKPLDYHSILSEILNNNVAGGAIMFIRRSVLADVGGYRTLELERLSYQDYDLSIRIAHKYKCINLSEVLYFYRQHNKSISKSINADRLTVRNLISLLGRQRFESGKDDLDLRGKAVVSEYLAEARKPYLQDPALVYREFAARYMYNQLYRLAIRASWSAVKIRPFDFINFRTLQYCFRIALAKKMADVSKD